MTRCAPASFSSRPAPGTTLSIRPTRRRCAFTATRTSSPSTGARRGSPRPAPVSTRSCRSSAGRATAAHSRLRSAGGGAATARVEARTVCWARGSASDKLVTMRPYPVDVFLPAAGFGERLRPATNHLPEPLLPILGTPIIEGILGKLAAVCDGPIGINLHWKANLLRAWAAASPWRERIVFFPEDPILGTGGALKNAESLLSRRAFIVHNSDILLDIDFARLVEEHLASGNVATLVCHRLPHLSNVADRRAWPGAGRREPGRLEAGSTHVADKVAYTGIAVYSPEILSFLPSGVSHATVAWVAASKAGHRVRAFDVTGAYWNDVGDPTTYARGVLDALRERGETVYRSATARCGRLEIDGYVVLESRTEVRDGSRLKLHPAAGRRRLGQPREPDHRARLHDLPLRGRHAAGAPRRREEAHRLERPALRVAFRDTLGEGARRGARLGLAPLVRRDPDRPRRVGPALLPRAARRADGGAHGMPRGRPRFRAPSRVHRVLRPPRRPGAGDVLVGQRQQAGAVRGSGRHLALCVPEAAPRHWRASRASTVPSCRAW